MSQDIAYRAGVVVLLRDGATWLISDREEKLFCQPVHPNHVWLETWELLRDQFPALSRWWHEGRAVNKPGSYR